jgi:hypothetical protein
VIFSDGVTDAQNAGEEEFGDERLVDCCKSIAAGIDANGVADRVLRAVADWSVGTEQFDDTTVVVMHVGISKTLMAPWRLDRCIDTARHVTVRANLTGRFGRP